ncbi:hypothetical protein Y032_0239g3333 [Ancylostoma ceylanicum]|uniref:Uncharacterized protein n=1 Tax=Ancylostoma ceylanicum TaxID=53326 RepID=A0A016SF02_9BILA|nr:hypothetical protein Y032_0239g3333 [Ancylostoma ceylanicum]
MALNELSEEALLGPVDGNVLEDVDREVEMELEQVQDNQVLELSERVQSLGQPSGPGHNAEPRQALGDVDYAKLDEWDPHILLAVAKAKLSRDKGKNTTYVGHR